MSKVYEIRQLSEVFYSEYDEEKYPEMERKKDRPYIVILVKIGKNTFAIPFRTNMNHDACYKFKNSGRKTKNETGLDFSKAVVVNEEKYIGRKVLIDRIEFLEIEQRYFFIISKFRRYISNYNRYLDGKLKKRDAAKYKYTTLKYFHKELDIDSD